MSDKIQGLLIITVFIFLLLFGVLISAIGVFNVDKILIFIGILLVVAALFFKSISKFSLSDWKAYF
ncbi:hypothetical protein [Acinetobacter vivianii]|uniref:hypothetical protein n=1 Tax=Acinetobacter vivianii TaxID=1776742 RepID=UPI0040421D08